MERSAIHVMAKRGMSQRGIARDLGISRETVARVLQEPIDRKPAERSRGSVVDVYRPQIEQWLDEGLSIVRMFELAREDEQMPFAGGRTTFSDRVRQIRTELGRQKADVPIRFEGLPGEYLRGHQKWERQVGVSRATCHEPGDCQAKPRREARRSPSPICREKPHEE